MNSGRYPGDRASGAAVRAERQARLYRDQQPRYLYAWGNNPRRAELKGRPCVLEATGAMGTVLIRFLDSGERVTTSRRALRKLATNVA